MKHAPLPIVLILALPLLAGCDSLMQKTGMQAAPAAAAPAAAPP
ncbi:LppP/LprE family lipoprotein, partial [Cereibacter changlensis]